MPLDGRKIQIEALQEHVTFRIEGIVETCAADAHRIKQFRHVGGFEAPLPKRRERAEKRLVRIERLISHGAILDQLVQYGKSCYLSMGNCRGRRTTQAPTSNCGR